MIFFRKLPFAIRVLCIFILQRIVFCVDTPCWNKTWVAIIWYLIPLPLHCHTENKNVLSEMISTHCVRLRRLLKSQCIHFSNFHSFLLCIRRRGSNSMNFGAACFKYCSWLTPNSYGYFCFKFTGYAQLSRGPVSCFNLLIFFYLSQLWPLSATFKLLEL